jgi:hypothetical protein
MWLALLNHVSSNAQHCIVIMVLSTMFCLIASLLLKNDLRDLSITMGTLIVLLHALCLCMQKVD